MKMMKLLVYSSDGKQRKRLLRAINAHSHQYIMETLADMKSLRQRIRRICTGEIWMVLVAATPGELHCLTTLGELIQNKRSILVLPDHQRKTVAAGHTLYPRFISYLDSDFSDVGSVLGTVIEKSRGRYN